MSSTHELTGMDEFAALLARILIGGFFTISGANNLIDLGAATNEAIAAGIPAAGLMVLVAATGKFILGILIIIKLQTKIAAFILSCYTVVASMLFYGPFKWDEYPQVEVIFFRNLAMLGGLLLMFAYARGSREHR